MDDKPHLSLSPRSAALVLAIGCVGPLTVAGIALVAGVLLAATLDL